MVGHAAHCGRERAERRRRRAPHAQAAAKKVVTTAHEARTRLIRCRMAGCASSARVILR